MQRAQRGLDNPALNLAVALGNALERPVLAVFGLTADYPSAQRRHYRFLTEGLVDAGTDLAQRGVPLVVRLGRPDEVVLGLVAEIRPAIVVGDENPVRVGQQWRRRLAERLQVPFLVVDADVVVPTSLFPKEEYAARTIRPKIHRVWEEYLKPLPQLTARIPWSPPVPVGLELNADALMARLKVGGVGEVAGYRGGTREALRRLDRFVTERLHRYASQRNQPVPYSTTELSAHLHFGHISPLTIALRVRDSGAEAANIEALLEELIVRRELAINFVARNPDYDRLTGCPDWAQMTLAKHAADPRPVIYDARTLEAGETHDPLWNAAQKEMVVTGRMHNYLRMYWAKKILEWTPDPETAFEIALDLNDRYEMDGRDPNGYTGVAWAIGGKHDRPWPERPIFGTVRFMSYESTRRKFDSAAYIAWIAELERASSP
jgi:deoxyribodipyrimidine photo-lyase